MSYKFYSDVDREYTGFIESSRKLVLDYASTIHTPYNSSKNRPKSQMFQKHILRLFLQPLLFSLFIFKITYKLLLFIVIKKLFGVTF